MPETSGPVEPSVALLRAALDSASEPIALVDSGRLVFANRALGRLLGAAEDGAALASLEQALGPLLKRITNVVIDTQLRWVHRDRELLVEVSVIPLPAGQQCCAIYARTADAPDRERSKPSSGNGRSFSLGQMTASVAHEINNPLAAVLANIEIAERSLLGLHAEELKKDALEGAQLHALREAIGHARKGAQRVRSIVKELMAFSRTTPDPKRPLNLETVLDASATLAWNEVRHRARLVKRYGQVPSVLGDEAGLGNVFLSLLLSTLHGIEAGAALEAELVLSTSVDGPWAVVEVADTGMREPSESRLLDPFSGTQPDGGRIGLGLSICRTIISSHGGDIAVKSLPGEGASVRIRLPIAAEPAELPRGLAAASDETAPRARILVIDDEPLLGQTLGFAFAGRHDVVITASGREALLLLEKDTHFDLVLCDLMMPDVSGQKVFEAVERQHPELVAHFVFMTGGAFTENAQEFLDRHSGRRIEKPFTIAEIEQLLGTPPPLR